MSVIKLKHSILALTSLLVLAACSEKDGDWDPMKWEKTSYATTKIEGKKFIEIPQQGGTYYFSCKNYDSFRLSVVNITTSGYGFTIEKHLVNDGFGNDWNPYHMSSDGCTVDIEGNTMTISFDYADAKRTYEVGITAGDIFDTFRFIQQ